MKTLIKSLTKGKLTNLKNKFKAIIRHKFRNSTRLIRIRLLIIKIINKRIIEVKKKILKI